MTAALDRDRLAKLLGMLASSHDGEVLNAARAAVALVRKAGTTLAAAVKSSPPASEQRRVSVLEAELIMVREIALDNARARDQAKAEVIRLKAEIARLDADLEEHLPSLDWATIAEALRRPGRTFANYERAYWKELEVRARTGKLTIEDRALLRRAAQAERGDTGMSYSQMRRKRRERAAA